MIPVQCRVKHDPENGTFGDCLRAVVASMLELNAEDVPHFYHDNCDGETGHERLRVFLQMDDLVPFVSYFPGNENLENILQSQAVLNPNVYYLLFCSTDDGDHVVICQDGRIVHNPSWVQSKVTGPNSNGYWGVMVFAKL